MTYFRAALLYSLLDGEEAVNTIGIEDDGLSTTQNIADVVATQALASFTDLADWATVGVSLDSVRVYRLPDLTGTAATEVADATIGIDGAKVSPLPPQCAIVASLLTGKPGKSFRGRVYLPYNAEALVDSDGRVSTAGQTEIAGAWAAFLGGINSAPDFRFCKVFSRTKGVATTITTVSVGNVYDTQRRRRNGLTEAYVTDTVSLV